VDDCIDEWINGWRSKTGGSDCGGVFVFDGLTVAELEDLVFVGGFGCEEHLLDVLVVVHQFQRVEIELQLVAYPSLLRTYVTIFLRISNS
jgi:hypothetical protein